MDLGVHGVDVGHEDEMAFAPVEAAVDTHLFLWFDPGSKDEILHFPRTCPERRMDTFCKNSSWFFKMKLEIKINI